MAEAIQDTPALENVVAARAAAEHVASGYCFDRAPRKAVDQGAEQPCKRVRLPAELLGSATLSASSQSPESSALSQAPETPPACLPWEPSPMSSPAALSSLAHASNSKDT
eukprot:7581029-Alexandrium_andersonii.AAC.1